MHISEHFEPPKHHFGTRISTPELRQSLKLAESFDGLEEDVRRYDLLVLVKRAGKAAGFTPRLIQLLDYYMAFTRDIDWEEGNNPIVYQSVTKTAMELDVTERQVRRMEHQLFDLGALTWCDSGNHRRYGQRDPETGQLLYGFGVDLTPLANLAGKLRDVLEHKSAHAREWHALKRQVSWTRAQIRSVLAEWAEQGRADELLPAQSRFAAISEPLRTSMSICQLKTLLASHKALLAEIRPVDELSENRPLTQKESAKGDKNVRHIEYTKQQQLSEERSSPADKVLQDSQRLTLENKTQCQSYNDGSENDEAAPSVPQAANSGETAPPIIGGTHLHLAGPSGTTIAEHQATPEDLILATGLHHITLKQALNAAGENFRDRIPLEPRPMRWADLVEAAYKRRRDLRIGQSAWAEACGLLGRTGAAVALLIVDRATEREEQPVRIPAAYFRAMIARARSGKLNLQASVFAWLKRGEGLPADSGYPVRRNLQTTGRP